MEVYINLVEEDGRNRLLLTDLPTRRGLLLGHVLGCDWIKAVDLSSATEEELLQLKQGISNDFPGLEFNRFYQRAVVYRTLRSGIDFTEQDAPEVIALVREYLK